MVSTCSQLAALTCGYCVLQLLRSVCQFAICTHRVATMLFGHLQELGLRFCTPNLHLLICRLAKQCKDVGDTVHFLELWVERCVALVKDLHHGRSTHDAEKVLAMILNHSMALDRFIIKSPTSMRMVEDTQRKEAALAYPDDNKAQWDVGKTHMQGAGRPWTEADGDKGEMLQAVAQKVLRMDPQNPNAAGWRASDLTSVAAVEHMQVLVYDRCLLRDGEVLYATSYKAAQRDSTHIMHKFTGPNDEDRMHVGAVQKFVLIIDTRVANKKPLRIAFVDFYRWRPKVGDADFGTVLQALRGDWGVGDDRNWPCFAEAIDCKLMYSEDTTNGLLLFSPYSFYSNVLG